MSLEEIDRRSGEVQQRTGGFRITLEDLKAAVESTEYVQRETLTVCVIRLRNGWWLVGKSAPVDPNNYDAEHGQHLAHEDALRQAWPLLAYAHLDRQS